MVGCLRLDSFVKFTAADAMALKEYLEDLVMLHLLCPNT
jgi:hypothetical protein